MLKQIKTVFNTFCGDSVGISLDGLQQAMSLLHGEMTRDEVMELFDFVDIDDSKLIDMKEFLVALTVGYVLEVIPAFSSNQWSQVRSASPVNRDKKSTQDFSNIGPEQPTKGSMSGYINKHSEIKEMLNLIVTAYLLFDPQAEGFIRKTMVEKLMEEDGHREGSNCILSEQRWKEMVYLHMKFHLSKSIFLFYL